MAARCPIPESEIRKYAEASPCLDVQWKLSALHRFLAKLKTSGANLLLPCGKTESDDLPDCWIGSNVVVLNSVLLNASLELREDKPGVLSLVTLVARRRAELPDAALSDAAFLVHWLLCYHRCVRTVHLEFDTVLCLCAPTVVAGALRRGSSVVCLRLSIGSVAERTQAQPVLTFVLESMVNLEVLDLGGVTLNYATVGGVVAVLKSGRLRTLVLGTCPQSKKVAHRLSRAVRKCAGLASLAVNGRVRCFPEIPSLLQTNTTLRSVSLSGVTGELVGEVLLCLARNDTLEELCLSDAALGDFPLTIEHIYRFAENRHLRVLKLTRLELGDAAAMAFAELLRENVTLEEVDFSGSCVGDFGAHALAEALTVNRSLKALWLEQSQLTDRAVDTFARALSLNECVERVSLGIVALPEEWCLPADVCDFNKLCGRLEVTWNTWGLERMSSCLSSVSREHPLRARAIKLCWTRQATIGGVRALFATASSLTFLNELVVGNMHSDEQGFAEAIAKLLVSTNALKKLELRELTGANNIVRVILNALARNSTVCYACFSCSLGTVGVANALKAVLNTNDTLHCIRFRSLHMRDIPLARFVQGIRGNNVLTDFSFDTVPNKEDVQDLWSLLWRNRCLLSRAVKHARGISVDRESMEAFSTLAGRDSLICALIEATGKTSAQCKDIVSRVLCKQKKTKQMEITSVYHR
ncbi:uncharacterized protein [Dermacentor albipictus]|uniref:uncharacterized protein n=1 Tax=Dermacentor albipictus TaxID=60249 RepID=UPI0038FBFF53